MKLLACAFIAIASAALAAAGITASDVSARIHRDGGKKVLADLWDQQAEFEVVLSGIESADREWLDVARLLKPFSDAGSAEEIDMAVARALPKDPERVLLLIGHDGFELDFVCTSPFDEPDAGVAEAYERRTLAALAAVKFPDLKAVAAQCAKHVKLPPAAG
jgi:hypothetical protein